MNARMIDHDEAVRDLMAERYLLGELNTSERDAYEEHLFSCDACFEQVRTGTEFVGHLRQIGTADPQAALAPGFFSRLGRNMLQPATIAAYVMLVCISGISIYQQRTIGGLRRAQVTPGFFLSDGARGEGIQKIVLPADTRFDLSLQLLHSGDFTSYQGQILDHSNHLKSSFPIAAEQTKETIHLLLDSSVLGSGNYSIVVNGFTSSGQKSEITRYDFQLQIKE